MFITVDKKAATEAESRAILEASYALDRPFGVPAYIFRPEELSAFSHEFIIHASQAYGPDNASVSDLYRTRDLFRRTYMNFTYECFAHLIWNRSERAASGEKTGEPLANIIYGPRRDMGGRQQTEMILGMNAGALAPLPGNDAQWQFMALWHEIAHGTGAGEPQAEKMAALVCRKVFADAAFLQARADNRAVHALTSYSTPGVADEYGWGMVEGLNQVIAMPDTEIEAMDEEAVKAVRFEEFESHAKIIRSLGAKLAGSSYDPEYDISDMVTLFNRATALIREGKAGRPGSAEHDMASRFALAARRLSIGIPAYYPPPEPVL